MAEIENKYRNKSERNKGVATVRDICLSGEQRLNTLVVKQEFQKILAKLSMKLLRKRILKHT